MSRVAVMGRPWVTTGRGVSDPTTCSCAGDDGGWLPFRDVFEVDGRRLRDRDDRLVRLLLHPSRSSTERAQRIMAESTRYNLGRITRTINIPTLGVILLKPGLREPSRSSRGPPSSATSPA